MKILMTGGGSGGHITPILAIAHELKRLSPDVRIVYVGQRGDTFGALVAEHPEIDAAYTVRAGKLRRYHGESWRQLLDFKTLWLNLQDVGNLIVGLFQSYHLMVKLKPDALFCKGGYVGVPVGLSAALCRVPYVTHDSDAIPGLANRLIARWAKCHAVALPIELYPYPAATTVDVGVPVSHMYELVDPGRMLQYRRELGLEQYKQIVLTTGGGLGAERINSAMVAVSSELLTRFPELCLVHTAGAKHEASVSAAYTLALKPADRKRVIVRDYLSDLYKYSGAADVVVARGGATNFAEFAAQAKACIIIPNPRLTGGHQTKNAEVYAVKGAAVVVPEQQLEQGGLLALLTNLLEDTSRRQKLSEAIHSFAREDAAHKLAEMLLTVAREGRA